MPRWAPSRLRQLFPAISAHSKALLFAAGGAAVVLVIGVSILGTRASGFFAGAEPESGTLSGNAQTVNDTTASGGKAVQFTAPPETPPPTPPPTLPPTRSCTGKPDAGCTGVTPGVVLSVVTGDQTYGPSANGQTFSGKDFKGLVKVTGANITFKDCKFEGRATSSNNALIDTSESTGTITIQDSEFVPSNPSATIDGLWLSNTNAYRINVHGSVDGMKPFDNDLIQDSYIHDMQWFASDPNQGGGETHNDGAQVYDNQVTLRHNNIDMTGTHDSSGQPAANAAIQASATYMYLDANWFDGGGCTVNIAQASHPSLTNIYITNNRFGRHQFYTGCAILIGTKVTLSQNSGNVWDDTGTPIPAPQQHD